MVPVYKYFRFDQNAVIIINGIAVDVDNENLSEQEYDNNTQAEVEGEGNSGGGHTTSALPILLMVDRLAQPLPSILIGPARSSSTRVEFNNLKIEEWQLSAEEHSDVQRVIASCLGSSEMPSFAPFHDASEPFDSEDGTNAKFKSMACDLLNVIYLAKGIPLRWRLPRPEDEDSTRPDFVLIVTSDFTDANGVLHKKNDEVLVAEGKVHEVMNTLDPAQSFNDYKQQQDRIRANPHVSMMPTPGVSASICYAVAQECLYLESRRLRFGFITTYYKTFYIKRKGPMHYAITSCQLNCSVRPSVPEMMLYLAQRSLDEGKVEPAEDDAAASAAAADAVAGPGNTSEEAALGSRSLPAHALADLTVPDPASSSGVADVQAECEVADTGSSSRAWSKIPTHALSLEVVLGEGLCGFVSQGRLRGQVVAVKCVDALNSAALVPHLQNEAFVLGHMKELQGECIPILYDAGFWQGGLVFVLAMSVIRGKHPIRGEQSPQSKASAVRALKAIHARGVAHGDIREDNILVEESGKVWFIDFGMSTLDPSPQQCQEELWELEDIFAPGSPVSEELA